MASNYDAICKENRESYGTKGAQKSGQLAAGLYDDRSHFIFELLQNAEDALGRRINWNGSRGVTFALDSTQLTVSHFGQPFDEADVRSVCDIAESTKNESSIGRFGLGFKSVYTVTDFPEIHSGEEDFAIEDYVFPKQIARSVRAADETQIILPLKPEDTSAAQDITTGFRQLGPSALLFLRHIDEINWSADGGASGFYRRNTLKSLGPNVNRITVIGKEDDSPEIDQDWLVFQREVFSTEGRMVGRVEIAFSLIAIEEEPDRLAVQPLAKSPLVAFFPTVVESHLGFLAQGPYRTTPSRDNIPAGDPWNQHLVKETTTLLVEAMRWMRDNLMLDVAALRCLPLERAKFPKGSRFAQMFDAIKLAFQEEALLPGFEGGYVNSKQAKLARTKELRELLRPEQVAALFGLEVAGWLASDITLDKAPEIRRYMMRELEIDEITPTKFVPSLTKVFLEAQPDDWVLRLYEFLNGQEKTLRRYLDDVPLIRLDDGSHVVARENGKAQAFLPCAIATSFPTMRPTVCEKPEIRSFLMSLGITEPNPVDDVIWNLLPKYQRQDMDVSDEDYTADIGRIRAAYNSDSATQKEKLRSALRDTSFVKVIDTSDGKAYVAKPEEIYIATDRLQQLFAGVPGILIVNNEYDCLRGEDIRDLLVWCGASRYLMPQAIPSGLGRAEKAQIRKEAGQERASWESTPEDFTIRGLAQVLEYLPTLSPEAAAARAKLLWEALADTEARGTAAFYGSYSWRYYSQKKTYRFDADFVKALNQTAWVPNSDGKLAPPGLVMFDSLDWKPNQFLQTKITFKPPIIDQLAKEVGIDPAILDLLRRDPTIVVELTSRLNKSKTPEPEPASEPSEGDVYDEARDLYGDDMPDILPGTPDPDDGDGLGINTRNNVQGRTGSGTSRVSIQTNGQDHGSSVGQGIGKGKEHDNRSTGAKRTPGQTGGRPFISYVGVHPNDDGSDPDGLDQAARMQIEELAIDLIIGLEPTLQRTPEGNPGFDLFEADSNGGQIRWVEVKSMTGTLEDRPAGLSRTQFDYAREKGDAFWLYVVEHATDPTQARVLRIQNPAGHAQTFTFDHGWCQIARTDAPN